MVNGQKVWISRVQHSDGMILLARTTPLAEVQRYATDLRQMTQGQGVFEMDFDHYQKVPPHLAETIIAAAKAAEEN